MPITVATNPDHIVLRVKDPVTSVSWYTNTLGLEAVRLEEFKAGVGRCRVCVCARGQSDFQLFSHHSSDTSSIPHLARHLGWPAAASRSLPFPCLRERRCTVLYCAMQARCHSQVCVSLPHS